jgi:CcmD family protein
VTWYLFAYVAFWAVLFGYLLGLSSRQARLNRRAAELTGRLIARSAGKGDA